MDTFTLTAQEIGTEYHLFLDTASRPDAPWVLVMDGDDQFSAAQEAARELSAKGVIPELTLVGVGYGGGYRSSKNKRARDYTQTQPRDEPMETGGAAAFHRFLERELLPKLRERLGGNPKSLGITGHSLGSLFALWAIAQPQPIFDQALLSSPSVWWDERSVLNDVRAAVAKPLAKPLRAFISVGEDDTPSMTGDLQLLEEQLKRERRENLYFVVQRFRGKDHYNVLPTAFRAGFTWLYGVGE